MADRDRGARRRLVRRVSAVVVTAVAVLGPGAAPGVAQTDEQAVADAEAAKATQVDAATAELTDITTALETLRAAVAEKSGQVDYANQQLVDAQALLTQTQADIATTESQVAVLEVQVSDMAVQAFTGAYPDITSLLTTEDPIEALRKNILRMEGTEDEVQLVDDLRNARVTLQAQQDLAAQTAAAAESLRVESANALAELQVQEQAQGNLVAGAEARLDQLLGEQEFIQSIGAEVAAGVDIDNLARVLANGPVPDPEDVVIPEAVSESDTRDAGKGIRVYVTIVDAVSRLLADADADGVNLAGWGWRSIESQVALRKAHCGSSNYAIYQMPASSCSPPTARPGASMHEYGMAIDFTYNGSQIGSHSNPGYVWLDANAAIYGLYNLPSEPWHWSTNGN